MAAGEMSGAGISFPAVKRCRAGECCVSLAGFPKLWTSGTQIFDLDRDAQAVQASCLTEGRIDIVHQLVDDFRDIVPAHKPAVARKAALNLNIIFSICKNLRFCGIIGVMKSFKLIIPCSSSVLAHRRAFFV